MDNNYEMIFCIVNAGFSETVMEASRECGAGGGTVISARGTASKESEQVYNISIEPEKEIVMILVKKEIKENANPRKWVCVEADEVDVESIDNTILFLMGEKQDATPIKEAFMNLAEAK